MDRSAASKVMDEYSTGTLWKMMDDMTKPYRHRLFETDRVISHAIGIESSNLMSFHPDLMELRKFIQEYIRIRKMKEAAGG